MGNQQIANSNGQWAMGEINWHPSTSGGKKAIGKQ